MKYPAAWFLVVQMSLAQIAIQDPSDPRRARLSGTVVDERGRLAAGVTVNETPPGPLGAALPTTQTDANGRFSMVGLLPGHTYVQAFDEKRFYPEATWTFWDGKGTAQVELTAGGEVSGIKLTLKPVGRLQVAARNAANGTPVPQIAVLIERDGAPSRRTGGSKMGNWWLVPPAPVRLCVEADGFAPAWYGGNGSFQRSVPIKLAPRQTFNARVSLRPLKDPAAVSNCDPGRGR